jgi:hypothetical protein
MKTALGGIYDYLNGLFGTTGTPATARAALGITASNIPSTATGTLSSTDVQSALAELDIEKVPRTGTTASAAIPSGTTAQRDGTPGTGYFRFNTSISRSEIYNGTSWTSLGGATGAGVDDVFYENGQAVSTNYTITSGKNAMSAGPITINSGITVTVPTGSVWSII